jgi:hypothetical protein
MIKSRMLLPSSLRTKRRIQLLSSWCSRAAVDNAYSFMAGYRLGNRADAKSAGNRPSTLHFPKSKRLAGLVALFAVMTGIYFYTTKPTQSRCGRGSHKFFSESPQILFPNLFRCRNLPEVALKQNEQVDRSWNLSCSRADYPAIAGCSPRMCGRIVSDNVIPDGLVKILSSLAQKILHLTPGGAGGPTIWDFHKGAVSYHASFLSACLLLSRSTSCRSSVVQRPVC